ncbi:WD40-repeat-containing domain protein [Lasiosphaeria ovina]|uniref:WD40-repeat-containing domain protein n=1 Tax=Lasiosphaeria ovina TaxID=92902 RepID=A0AAE0KDV5_9PEZI|nr:WD40-repeat-containing domain protein [Lasiosphaeria ovina]
MAGGLWKKLGLSRWRKKIQEKEMTQKDPKTNCSVASANSSEANIPRSEQAASSTTVTPPILRLTTNSPDLLAPAVPPAPSNTATPASLSNTSDKVKEKHPVAIECQALDIGEGPAAGVSLWDRAYDVLKEEKPDRVTEYEQLLSRVLIRALSTPQAANGTEDVAGITNHVPQNDPIARREKLKEIMELGLKHMEDKKISTTLLGREIVLQDAVAKVAGAVEWVEAQVKDAIKDLPYASIVMAGVSLVLPLLKNPAAAEEANRDGFTYVTSQMRYFAAMESLLLPQDTKSDLKDDLTERLVDFYKLIIDFQVQSIIRFYRTRTKNFFRGTVNYDGWDQKLQDIKDTDAALVARFETAMSASSLQELRVLAREAQQSRKVLNDMLIRIRQLVVISRDHLDFARKMDRRMSDADNRTCLRDLQTTNPYLDKERIELAKGGLLKDSYSWVLENVDFHRLRGTEQSRLLWIKGDPGKGKTMLLCGIIDELVKSTPSTTNVTFFFCQATDNRINNATAVLRGLLYLLVKQQRSLISHIREIYDDSGKQCFEGTNAWVALSKILIGILNDGRLHDTYFVIDALDECTTDLDLLLNFIVRESAAHSNVKWIVSSRNWPSIERGLDTTLQKVKLSLELNEKSVSAAVNAYIQFKVNELAKQNGYDSDTWNGVRQYLSLNANGTFLWVALVCHKLANIPGWEAQEKLTAFPPGLDAFYRRMMDQIRSLDDVDADLCKSILAVVSVVYRPITVDELASLVNIPSGASGNYRALAEIIERCGSFLTLRERAISFVHQSAKDFLTQKASGETFPSGIRDVHHVIFSRSLRVLTNTLRRDIYSLGAPGSFIEDTKLPDPDPLAAARYACVYWVDHLHDWQSSDNTKHPDGFQDGGAIEDFLRQHYLHWLEALSLCKSMSQGIFSMAKLENFLQQREITSQLPNLIYDMRRFVLYCRWLVENHPLQVYASALVFSPARSITRDLFKQEESRWITTGPAVEDDWNACRQTLEGHSDWVTSVAFSPDSKLVTSGSNDKTVKIWDTATGVCTQTLEGHSGWVRSVVFSPDSKLITSGSDDRTVKIWNTATGAYTQTLEGHSGYVMSVAFSPDSKLIISGSADMTIKIWDTATGVCTQTLEGHSGWVTSVAFSPDSKLITSGSDDRTVKIWNAATGVCTQTLEGHSGYVLSVAFSPDSKLVTSGSNDRTVKIWDTATGVYTQTLEGHSGSVTSVAFSPDLKLVTSGSNDRTVKIWNAATGVCTQTLEGHSVTSVAFSPDSKLITSGSVDSTVKIWDAATGVYTQTLEGHSGSVTSVAFSPDLKLVTSGSNDRTVKIWDAATGVCTQTLEGHSGSVTSVAFSPDSKLITSGSVDSTVKIWDAATGVYTQTLEGHSDWVRSVAFSPDSKLVASGSNNKTVKIWDAATGACTQTLENHMLEGHSDWVRSVAFSPDSKLVTSGSFTSRSGNQDYSIGSDDRWIMRGSENWLWLPPGFRPVCSAVVASTIAIGCLSGRVLIITFPTDN